MILTEEELRNKIREMILEKIDEAIPLITEKKTGSRKRKQKKKINPPITDLTRLSIKAPETYKGKVRAALAKTHGHIGAAADLLGASESTLKRHIARNFGDGELETAPPGPDPMYDTATKEWEKKKDN